MEALTVNNENNMFDVIKNPNLLKAVLFKISVKNYNKLYLNFIAGIKSESIRKEQKVAL